MHNRDFHHERAAHTRRLTAWIFLALSLLILIGTVVYSLETGLIPGAHIQLPPLAFPGSNHSSGASTCSTPEHAPGEKTLSLTSGGLQRTFIVHLPPSYGQQPLPLIFNYHGYDRTAANFSQYTNMGAEADQEHFIVVFPQGEDAPATWNAGTGALGPTGTADDVQFTQDMITYLTKNYCVNAHRIYVAGYSIGASMAYRVACALSKEIAALATVEGAFYSFPGGCQPSRPLPLLDIHGEADQLAPYNGDPTRDFASVQQFLATWFAIDHCKTNNSQVIFQQADVTAFKWASCSPGVQIEHYRISDGGHVWPGSAIAMPSLGYTTHTISANAVIWNFFSGITS